MQVFKCITMISLFAGLIGPVWAEFRPRSGEFLAEDIEKAQAQARSDNKALTFILTNPDTTCGLAIGMFDEVRRGLRGRSILVFCNSGDTMARRQLPRIVSDAFSAPESGRFIPTTVVVDAEITRVLAHVPYVGDQRERSRLIREARSSIADQPRTRAPAPSPLPTAAASGSRTWTDVYNRQVEGEYVSSTDTQVTIRLDDGTEIMVDVNKLSPADRHFVRSAAAP